MRCPLCASNVKQDESIYCKDLILLWDKVGVSVSHLFNKAALEKLSCKKCGLGFFSPMAVGDDAFYSKLATWDWYYKHPDKGEYTYSAQLLKSGMGVIDVGCGIGEFEEHMPDGVEFLGAELSSKSVEIAQSLGRNVRQLDVVASATKLEGKFDVVTCFQVLEHVSDIDAFFSALVQICRPGGLIVIAVPNNDGFVGSAINNAFNLPPHHVFHWNKKSLYFLAEKYSLAVVDYVEEPVAEVHREWFFTVIMHNYLRKAFGRKSRLVDISMINKMLNSLCRLFAWLISKILFSIKQPGHSSIIVLRRDV